MTWEPGDTVALREIWQDRVWSARPAVVVEDTEDGHSFFIPPGTSWRHAVGEDGQVLTLPVDHWRMAEMTHERQWKTLSFAWPNTSYAVLLSWDDPTGLFLGWYVNLQSPLRSTATGFNYVDHVLDVVVAPDRSSWSWKDEDELSEAVARGIFTSAEAASFRVDGEHAIRRLLDGEPPFDRSLQEWRPDPTWPVPHLPEGWDVVENQP